MVGTDYSHSGARKTLRYEADVPLAHVTVGAFDAVAGYTE